MKSTFKALAALLVVFMLLSVTTSAQSENPFQKNSQVGQLGLGLGMAGIAGTASMPPISAGFQYGIEDKISVGGVVAYASSSYDAWGDYSWKYTYILIGARGEYHFLETVKNMDGYAGVTLGYNIVSFTEPTGYSSYFGHLYNPTNSYFVFGVHGGVRYFFNPNFAVFGELGYGLGILTAGIAYKF